MALDSMGGVSAPTLTIVVYDGGIVNKALMVDTAEWTFDLEVTYQTRDLAHLRDGRMPGGAAHKVQAGTVKWSGITISALGSQKFTLDFMPRSGEVTQLCWVVIENGVPSAAKCRDWPYSVFESASSVKSDKKPFTK